MSRWILSTTRSLTAYVMIYACLEAYLRNTDWMITAEVEQREQFEKDIP